MLSLRTVVAAHVELPQKRHTTATNSFPVCPLAFCALFSDMNDPAQSSVGLVEFGEHEHPDTRTCTTDAIPIAEALGHQDGAGLLRLPKKKPPLRERSLFSILSEEVVVEEDTIFGPPPLQRRISSLSEQPRLVRRVSNTEKLLNISGDAPAGDGPTIGEKSRLETGGSPCAIQCVTVVIQKALGNPKVWE